MQEELRRLEARILDLAYKLEVVTVDVVGVERRIHECLIGSPEHGYWSYQKQLYRMRSEEFRAKIVAAHARLGRLKLEAEVERLWSLQRRLTQVELAHLHTLSESTRRHHRRLAVEMIRRASDTDRASQRVTGVLPMPERVRKQEPQEQYEVPRQQQQYERRYRGRSR